MVDVKKKPRETTPALLRRFSSKLRLSGVINEAKKRQYHKKELNEKEKKNKALKKLDRAGKR